jgi:SAM-dependent methyltransferase
MTPLEQHQKEIQRNLLVWQKKPLLQEIYAGFYRRIIGLIDQSRPEPIVEIGSGIGNLKAHLPRAICTDLFPNPWLDLVCDGYRMPFADRSLSHLVLSDVFHHLRAPKAFLSEAKRVLVPSGRIILSEPFISAASYSVYGLLHHEPIGWRDPIDLSEKLEQPHAYYAAQGNATRLFFQRDSSGWLGQWRIFHRESYASFAYFLSGGYSKPALYPSRLHGFLCRCDATFSRWPKIFGGRCLIGLTPLSETH